jgi:hypothetical protein
MGTSDARPRRRVGRRVSSQDGVSPALVIVALAVLAVVALVIVVAVRRVAP